MKILLRESLGINGRAIQIAIGLVLSISLLLLPYPSGWIALVAFISTYPLMAGLTATDPVFALFKGLIVELLLHKKTNTAVTA